MQTPDKLSDAEVYRGFSDLLAGRINHLKIALAVAATQATRETPICGVWAMTREQFVKIAENLQATHRLKDRSLEEIANICDETGIENRFFRLNPAVAEWIDNHAPESEIDYIIF